MSERFTTEELLARWLNEDLSPEELAELEQRPDYPELKKAIETAGTLQAPTFSAEASWQQFEANLPAEERIEMGQTRIISIRRYLAWGSAAAAIALLVVGYILIWGSTADTVHEAGRGKVMALTLPDGSEVQLNAVSKLSYAAGDWPDTRELQLEGEAYFKVKKGSNFLVKTTSGQVRVVGTAFNVQLRDGRLDVRCDEGIVEVSSDDVAGETLLKGQAVRIKGGKSERYQFDTGIKTWRVGEFHFYDEAYANVIAEVERQYDIDIEHPAITDRLYTGWFRNDDLQNTLETITLPMGLQYEQVDAKRVRIY